MHEYAVKAELEEVNYQRTETQDSDERKIPSTRARIVQW